MESKKIRRELCTLIMEAERRQYALANYQMEYASLKHSSKESAPIEWIHENDDEHVNPFRDIATSIYLHIIALLDVEGMDAYLEQFYQRFGKVFNVDKAVSEFDIDFHGTGEPFNTFISEINQFISPLSIIQDADRYLRLSGVKYLETILNNTATIINKSGIQPKKETDVYNAVRYILEAIFPTAISPKSNFLKTSQEYKPDILIPELSTVIEYKYAADETRLKTILSQISDDEKGYSGDSDYNLFYAVFYVTDDFWGKEKFDIAWKEKKFPKNWRYFYVVGK
ncbi:hypothetical protein ACPER7_08995 [Acinetobacter dispersus]|uniref:PD-(D/E)XK nuclease domain-containing protein n=1 Tax=Acinetobacter dispersus TaxID=70348 RepID=UPI003C3039B7